ncbi:MAG: glycosyltransferase [Candidatus Electrothrix sp. AR4]|nr:glycosyltransferase [Candidatus Electrothrix sp. AR4]
MKTLVIAPQPFFSPRGTPFSVYYRTMISSELGAKMDFLTYGQGQDVVIPGVRFFRTPSFAFLGAIKIGPSMLKLFHDIFIFFRMLELLLRNKYDCVHAHEEAVFPAVLLKPIFRFKLIYDMHSSLPQQLTNFNFTELKLLIKLFTWLENKSLAASDAVITICPDLYNYVESVFPGNDKNFLIENSIFDPVHLAADPAAQDGAEKLPVAIPDSFVHRVVYAGTLESYQGIDVLIQSVAHVVQINKEVGFIIVGGTEEQVAQYREMAASCGVSQYVIFTERVAQAIARAYSEQASVLVSPRSSGTNTPLKIYEQLDSGIPLVATSIYSHTQILNKDVAFMVRLDPEDMADGIIQAIAEGGEGRRRAKNAKALYAEQYSRKAYISKLRNALERVS